MCTWGPLKADGYISICVHDAWHETKSIHINVYFDINSCQNKSETSNKIIFPGAIIYYKEGRTAINFLENRIGVSPQININNSIWVVMY